MIVDLSGDNVQCSSQFLCLVVYRLLCIVYLRIVAFLG